MPIELSYRGTPGVDDMGAFNARTSIRWKGEMVFRVYPIDGKLYFIKVGASKNSRQVVAVQFGLIGLLIAHWMGKKAEGQAREKLHAVSGVHPEQLLAEDKLNWSAPVEEITDPALHPASFSTGRYGTFSYRDARGKKRVFTFEDADNFQAAARRLPAALGEKLTVLGRWDDAKRKVVKV
jgi:hypothetical protein